MDDNVVRFSIILTPDLRKAIESLQEILGLETIEETIIRSMAVFGIERDENGIFRLSKMN